MPSSVDGKYVEHKDDDEKSDNSENRNRSNSKISNASSKKNGSLSDKDRHSDRHSDDGRDEFQNNRDDGEAPVLTKKFHIIMIILIATTWVCLLAIIPTRSLGLSGKLVCLLPFYNFNNFTTKLIKQTPPQIGKR